MEQNHKSAISSTFIHLCPIFGQFSIVVRIEGLYHKTSPQFFKNIQFFNYYSLLSLLNQYNINSY